MLRPTVVYSVLIHEGNGRGCFHLSVMTSGIHIILETILLELLALTYLKMNDHESFYSISPGTVYTRSLNKCGKVCLKSSK